MCYDLQVHTPKLYLAYKPCLAHLKQQQSGAQQDVVWAPCVVQPHITLSLPIQENELRQLAVQAVVGMQGGCLVMRGWQVSVREMPSDGRCAVGYEGRYAEGWRCWGHTLLPFACSREAQGLTCHDCHKWWATVVEIDLKRRAMLLCNIIKSI